MAKETELKPELTFQEVKDQKEAKKEALVLFLSDSEEKEHFLSKRNRKLLTDPLDDNNPITVQVL